MSDTKYQILVTMLVLFIHMIKNIKINVEDSKIGTVAVDNLKKNLDYFDEVYNFSQTFDFFTDFTDKNTKDFIQKVKDFFDTGFHEDCFKTEMKYFRRKIFIKDQLIAEKVLEEGSKWTLGKYLELENAKENDHTNNILLKNYYHKNEKIKNVLDKLKAHFEKISEYFIGFSEKNKIKLQEQRDILQKNEDEFQKYDIELKRIHENISKKSHAKRKNNKIEDLEVDQSTIINSYFKAKLKTAGFNNTKFTHKVKIYYVMYIDLKAAFEVLKDRVYCLDEKYFNDFCDDYTHYKKKYDSVFNSINSILGNKNMNEIVNNENTYGNEITLYKINSDSNYSIFISPGMILKGLVYKLPEFKDYDFKKTKYDFETEFESTLFKDKKKVNELREQLKNLKKANFITLFSLDKIGDLETFKKEKEKNILETRETKKYRYIMSKITGQKIYSETPTEGNTGKNVYYKTKNDQIKKMESLLGVNPEKAVCVYQSNFKTLEDYTRLLLI